MLVLARSGTESKIMQSWSVSRFCVIAVLCALMAFLLDVHLEGYGEAGWS